MEKGMDPNELIEYIRGFNKLIGNSANDIEIITGITKRLAQITKAWVYITNNYGKLLAAEGSKSVKQLLRLRQIDDGSYIDAGLSDLLNAVAKTEGLDLNGAVVKNITRTELSELKTLALPLNANCARHGTLLLVKTQEEFFPTELMCAEICVSIISLILVHEQKEELAEEQRRQNIVRSAIGTLSYSELEAMLLIFDELPGNEGLLVTSKIADKVGITRSVIVNALRKLESAGVIESRSLGMKGTYIKVLNVVLIGELNKIRKL